MPFIAKHVGTCLPFQMKAQIDCLVGIFSTAP